MEIARRRVICSECPFTSSNAVKDGYKHSRFDEHCIMCGCAIAKKTASMVSNCGIDCCNGTTLSDKDCGCKRPNLKEYNQENNINMPLKWVAYKKETDDKEQTKSA